MNRAAAAQRSERAPPYAQRWTEEMQADREPWYMDDGAGHMVVAFDSVPMAMAGAGAHPEEVWLWCQHCCRFFQAKHLKLDFLGFWGQCPFDDCGIAGLDVDILVWNNGRHDPGWPSSTDELYFGMQYPRRERCPAGCN